MDAMDTMDICGGAMDICRGAILPTLRGAAGEHFFLNFSFFSHFQRK